MTNKKEFQSHFNSEALSGWEEKLVLFIWGMDFSDPSAQSIAKKIMPFIRQTIKTEREQAVKEAYQSPEFTDVFEYGKKQAVKEVIEEIEKGLPKEKSQSHIVYLTNPPQYPKTNDLNYCNGYNDCLEETEEFINKLKAKYK